MSGLSQSDTVRDSDLTSKIVIGLREKIKNCSKSMSQ